MRGRMLGSYAVGAGLFPAGALGAELLVTGFFDVLFDNGGLIDGELLDAGLLIAGLLETDFFEVLYAPSRPKRRPWTLDVRREVLVAEALVVVLSFGRAPDIIGLAAEIPVEGSLEGKPLMEVAFDARVLVGGALEGGLRWKAQE